MAELSSMTSHFLRDQFIICLTVLCIERRYNVNESLLTYVVTMASTLSAVLRTSRSTYGRRSTISTSSHRLVVIAVTTGKVSKVRLLLGLIIMP